MLDYLNVGDVVEEVNFFMLYNETEYYYIDVVETRPGNAVSVVDTDCEVEFVTPLDFKRV